MADGNMWDDPVDPGSFALPGDEELYGGGPAKEEPVAAEPEAEAPEEEAPQERPRNPDGTFAAQTQEEETPAEEAERLLANKFKNADELERAYLELQSRMGIQGSEMAELRKAVADLPAQIQQQPQRVQYDYDTLIANNPAQAAEIAYNENDTLRFNQAIEEWEERSPGTPLVWAQQKAAEEKQTQRLAAMEERLANVDQLTAKQTADRAFVAFSRTHPDVDQYADQMSEVLMQSPHLQPLIESGDPQAKVELLDYLYTKAKGVQARGDADNLSNALRSAAQDTARAEEEAAVVSTSQRTAEPETPSEAQRIGKIWEDYRKPFDEGWNIQSG